MVSMTNREFDSYLDTFYEISTYITSLLIMNKLPEFLKSELDRYGSTVLRDHCKTWTEEFERINNDNTWDGDFYDEVQVFVLNKCKSV